MIGENLSASVAYLTGRFFGTHIPELRKSPIVLDNEKTFSSILFTRLAFFPFDLVNYLSGFLRLPWIPFALATLTGIIPGALVFIIAGASIEGIESFSQDKVYIVADRKDAIIKACNIAKPGDYGCWYDPLFRMTLSLICNLSSFFENEEVNLCAYRVTLYLL